MVGYGTGMGCSLLHGPLHRLLGALAARQLRHDGHEPGELLAHAVREDRGHAGGLHLGLEVVQPHKAGRRVGACDLADAVLDLVALVALYPVELLVSSLSAWRGNWNVGGGDRFLHSRRR